MGFQGPEASERLPGALLGNSSVPSTEPDGRRDTAAWRARPHRASCRPKPSAENRRRTPHSRAELRGTGFRLQPRAKSVGGIPRVPSIRRTRGRSVFEHGFDGDDGPHAESTLPQQVLRISVHASSVLPHPAPPRRDYLRNSA